MKKIVYSSLTLLLLAACSGEQSQEKQKESVLDQKIDVVKEAKNVVNAVNTQTEEKNKETEAKTVADTVNAQAEEQVKENVVKKELSNGASIYKSSCSSCHGENAEKPALNVSAILSTWSSQQIQDALLGYKKGTYGGAMKGIMQGQSKPLSEAEIKLVADYISTL